MAFDQNLGRVVLFGGSSGGATRNDTWWWDGSDWQPIFTAVAPSPRHAHAMAYDGARGRLVLFGGYSATQQSLGDVHEWDGGQWFALQPATSPPARFHAVLAYDGYTRRCVLSGGNGGQLLADTWWWDGVNWTNVAISGPSARYQSAGAFDARRGRLVLFGGGDGVTTLTDTWEFDGGTSAPVAATAVFGVGCGIPPVTIAPAAGSRPLLGGQQVTNVGNLAGGPCLMTIGLSSSHAGPVALPLPLGLLGMGGCRLYHDLAIAVEPCAATGPTTAFHVLAIPPLTGTVGRRAYLQVWATAAGANEAGIATSNAIELVLGDV
jgi:hypothetical protein